MEQKVFDKEWFIKHQSKLLWLANSWLGKYIFQFKKMGHYLTSPIVKITPCSVTELVSIKNIEIGEVELKEHFFGRNEYARKLYFALLPMWYVMHIWDWFVADHFRLAPQLSFGFSTLTQNPATIGTDNPVDGRIRNVTAGVSWATLIAATDGTGAFVGSGITSTRVVGIASKATINEWEELNRAFFCFDTSSLTAGATISAAVLSLYGSAKTDALSATPNVDIYTSSPANTNALVVGDFDQVGSTSQTGSTPITYAGWSTTAYNDFTFDATGRGNVSKTAISKFGARNANYDVAASAPTHNSAAQESTLQCYYSGNGSLMPQLVVTYTIVVGPANLKSYNTNLSANIKSIDTNLIANVKSLDTNV